MSSLANPLAKTQDALTKSTPCPSCGAQVQHPEMLALRNAYTRIQELESQIRTLTLRATSAVERVNEYESTLRRPTWSTKALTSTFDPREGASQSPAGGPEIHTNAATPSGDGDSSSPFLIRPPPPPNQAPQVTHSRLARLLTRSASSSSAPPSTAPLDRPAHLTLPAHLPSPGSLAIGYPATAGLPQTEKSLLDALTHEQGLRLAAETAAARTNNEIEELTGQLFEQANEMVASERRERARLEQKVVVLEKRDGEKSKRLGTLEKRVLRVERVRNLLEKERDLGATGLQTSTTSTGQNHTRGEVSNALPASSVN